MITDAANEPRLAAVAPDTPTDSGAGTDHDPNDLPYTPTEWNEIGVKNILVRLLHYLTNYVINKIPSFTVRHLWYRKVLGADLAEGCCIYLNCFFWFYGPNQARRTGIRIGQYSRINRNCCIDARGPVDIGNQVSISPDVHILTTHHLHNSPRFEAVSLPVVIEDHVWIGARATILPGTTIGRGAVVAAGSVVRGTIPPFAVVAGVPAKPIGERNRNAVDYLLRWPPPLFE